MAGSSRRRTASMSDAFGLGQGRTVGNAKAAQAPIETTANPEVPPTRKPWVPPASRAGLKAVQFYLDPAAHKQLAILAIREEVPIQTLVAQALDQLFSSRGLPVIATLPDRNDGGQSGI